MQFVLLIIGGLPIVVGILLLVCCPIAYAVEAAYEATIGRIPLVCRMRQAKLDRESFVRDRMMQQLADAYDNRFVRKPWEAPDGPAAAD